MRTFTSAVTPLLVGAWIVAGVGVLTAGTGEVLWLAAGVLVGLVVAIGPTLDITRSESY